MPFRLTLSLALALALATAQADSVRLLVQNSPLAGSQYYAVAEVWPELRVGDLLTLVREPENRHDPRAIRVEWRGHKLGYLPRAENRTVSAALDQGDRLVARIVRLNEHQNPWKRVEIAVFAEL